MADTEPPAMDGRPCRYCVANWLGIHNRIPGGDSKPVLPTEDDCEAEHRDDPRVYALARALAEAMQNPDPTDEQIGWFLADADEVVDDFRQPPSRWLASKLPAGVHDEERGIEVRLRINGVVYVALEGGKHCRGSVMTLAEFRDGENRG